MSKKKDRYDFHHRLPVSRNGTDTFPTGNLKRVNKVRHAHFHALFTNRSVESIVDELNEVWLDPRVKLVITIREASV